MEPEKKSLEKEISFKNHHFQVPCKISGEYVGNCLLKKVGFFFETQWWLENETFSKFVGIIF